VRKEYAFLFMVIAFVAGMIVGVVAAVYYEDKTPLASSAVKQSTPSQAAPPENMRKQIHDLQSILRDDPKNLNVLIQLGNFYFEAGQINQAIETYSEALEIDPENADVRTDLGIMYRRKGDYDKAIAEFKKATQIDPRHGNSRYNLGIVLLHDKGDLKGAIKAWEDYLKVEPTGPRADNIRNQMARMKSMVR
jgi:cytochrome c-type biogenesis protein CcmH/NrfG